MPTLFVEGESTKGLSFFMDKNIISAILTRVYGFHMTVISNETNTSYRVFAPTHELLTFDSPYDVQFFLDAGKWKIEYYAHEPVLLSRNNQFIEPVKWYPLVNTNEFKTLDQAVKFWAMQWFEIYIEDKINGL